MTAGASHSHSLVHGHPASPSDWPVALLQRSVDWTQQYITVRLYEGTFSDSDRRGVSVNDIAGPVKWLGEWGASLPRTREKRAHAPWSAGLLNSAAEEYLLLRGRRAVPYKLFYNQVVSEEINLHDGKLDWQTSRVRPFRQRGAP